MAKEAYVGVSGAKRKLSNIYVGVSNAKRRVVKGYVGVNGSPRLFWDPDSGGGGGDGETITTIYAPGYTYLHEGYDFSGDDLPSITYGSQYCRVITNDSIISILPAFIITPTKGDYVEVQVEYNGEVDIVDRYGTYSPMDQGLNVITSSNRHIGIMPQTEARIYLIRMHRFS